MAAPTSPLMRVRVVPKSGSITGWRYPGFASALVGRLFQSDTRLHDPPLDGSDVVVLVEVTVSVALPLTLPLVPTMFVVPAATAVIKPAAVTVAMEGEALVH